MTFTADTLRTLVRDTLSKLDPFVPYSEDAVELLMLTAAVETQLGENPKRDEKEDDILYGYDLKEYFGIFGMTVTTEEKIFETYLSEHPELAEVVRGERAQGDRNTNYPYQIMLARIVYAAAKPVPPYYNNGKRIRPVATFWEKHYRESFVDFRTYKEAQAFYNELCRSTDVFYPENR